jgi:hypothetical protein
VTTFVRVKLKFIYTFCLLFALISFCSAQKTDSSFVVKPDSAKQKKATKKAIYSRARKATIMSAVFPGLGQIYNRKYWKAPVIYAALGGLAYWGINNHTQFKYYSDNLKAIYDDDPSTENQTLYSDAQLITQKNYYRKYRDMAMMLGTLVYVINIIDANVDAHLKSFDVSDDLSLKVKPYYNINYNSTLQTGLTLKLSFK